MKDLLRIWQPQSHPQEQVSQQLVHHSSSNQDQAILLSYQMLHLLHHLWLSQVVCIDQDYVQEQVDCDRLKNEQITVSNNINLIDIQAKCNKTIDHIFSSTK